MFTDIKDNRFALSALEESSLIVMTDAWGSILYVNRQFSELSRFDSAELVGESFRKLLAGSTPRHDEQALQEAVLAGKVWKGEWHCSGKDERSFWAAITVIPFLDAQDRLYQCVAIGSDITSRKRDELLLLQTMDNLRDIEHALDESSIVAITDYRGMITYVNERFCHISMYGQDELLGKTHRVINSGYHPKRFFKQMWDTITAGRVWRGEVKNRAKDGTEYWMNTTIVPFLDDNGKPRQFISIRTDITDRMKAEAALAERTEQLARARDEAVKASMIKSQFLANMSHELRTPLNAIIGYSEMLKEEASELGEPVFAEDLDKIRKAGDHLLSLINDILDISKIEAGKMELLPETCVLGELAQDVMTTIRPLVSARGNRLEFRCEEEGELTTDIVKLRQILINLLGNASKFTEEGNISFEIYREARSDGDGFSFSVADTGIGMTPEQVDKLFQPFTQADASMTRKYGGTGLGLAISSRYSSMLGGDIRVESKLGQGSRFICWLPKTSPCPLSE